MKNKIGFLTLTALVGVSATAAAQNTFPTNGNVGIGTTNPGYPLVVRGQTAQQHAIALEDSVGNTKWHIQLNYPAPGLDFGQTGVAEARLFLAENGNAGIGTHNPQARLDVNGVGYFQNGTPAQNGTIINLNANAGNQTGGGIAIGDDGGFFDVNDGFVTYKSLCCGSGLKVDANFTVVNGLARFAEAEVAGGLELRGGLGGLGTPYIDFSFNQQPVDYSMRLICDGPNTLSLVGGTFNVAGKINCTVLELTSDRNQKQDFQAVDPRQILDRLMGLSITTWSYTNDAKVRHLGPMAQEFKAAFPEIGSDDKHIGAGDLSSVALAAIQGLNELVQEKDARIAALEKEVATLRSDVFARLASLEKQTAQSATASTSGPSDQSTVATSVEVSSTR